jgi:hypothetical protein
MAKKQYLNILGILLVISIISFLPIINAGNQILSYSVTFGGNHFDTAYSLAWDFGNPSGKLYVVGSSNSFNPSFNKEGIVAMFGENLETPSTVVKMSGFDGHGEFLDVAVGPGMAVVGFIPNNKDDPVVYWLSKTNLNTVAARQLQVFTGTERDWATAVAFDSIGDTIVAGFTDSGSGSFTGRSSFLVKLQFEEPTIIVIGWQVAFKPLNAESSLANALTVDCNNNIIVVGSFNDPGQLWDAYVAKFNPNGAIVWLRTLGDSKYEDARAVAVDNFGNIYVAGRTNSFKAPNDHDVFVAKFDPYGNLLWFKTINFGPGDDIANSIAVIQNDHVYITGVTYSTSTDGDTFFAKLSATGEVLYVMVSNMSGEDIGFKVALNIHSTKDIFYVNIAGRSVASPGNFTPFTTFTVSSPSVTSVSRSASTTNPGITLTPLGSLVSVTTVNIPDNVEQRAVVYKFDPPTAFNETKNNINNYLSYWLIPIIIVSIFLTTVLIKRKNK